ncbi:unnamed protein product [Amoebophrya sp. A120]|nr:unnamed protein product [Amoebophrya sp. A120]|eukprot:GSA120T00023755001.1
MTEVWKALSFSRRCTGHALASCVLLTGGITSDCVLLATDFLSRFISFVFGAKVEDLATQAPCAILPHLEGVHAGLLKYRQNSEGALGNGLPQVLDEAETLVHTRSAAFTTTNSSSPADVLPATTTSIPLNFNPPEVVDVRNNGEKLIALTQAILRAEFGTLEPSLLAEDFRFVFPVVGPLSKKEFVDAFSSFQVRKTFPYLRGNFFGFQIDPLEPDRVWFFSRGDMYQAGPLELPGRASGVPNTGQQEDSVPLAPAVSVTNDRLFSHTDAGTGTAASLVSISSRRSSYTLLKPNPHKRVLTPVQVLSMSFHADGKCYKFTGGYVADRTDGNCNGLGGFFGVLHALGVWLPFPEGRPWKPSPFWQVFVLRAQQVVREWRQL